MTTEVKICGLRTVEALDAAIDAGADYVGLVHYPKSPRHVSLAEAARLAAHVRSRRSDAPSVVVVLLVDPDDALVREVMSTVAPDLIQLHGHESPARVAAVAGLGVQVLKAVGIATRDDLAHAAAYLDMPAPVRPRLMLDAKPPTDGTALPGGNGLAFDWRLLEGWQRGWYILAGGLNAANVAAAIRLTNAPAVDVSSGVERAAGEKDPAKIRAFIAAAKGIAG